MLDLTASPDSDPGDGGPGEGDPGGVPALAVYVHWPFCESKCPYCDFNSHVRERIDHQAWRDALLRDLAFETAATPDHRVVSIFFGGGTPSLAEPATIAAVIEAVGQHWSLASAVEITLEANPSSVEAARFAAYATAGVNRVSLGVQALNDPDLAFLGRRHSVSDALRALEIADRTFGRVSFDLIYARPGQSLDAWDAELTQALAFGTEHLSLYQLTIEAGTAFAEQYRRKRFVLPDEDLAADLFALTQSRTAAAGLPAYEISNHARPGAESRHNLVYWQSGDYVGIGPGAHGRRAGAATTRVMRPEAWLTAVETQGHGLDAQSPLDPQTRALEAVLMGLRLSEGINPAAFRQATGVALQSMLNHQAVQDLSGQGLLTLTDNRLAVTPQGRGVLNAILGAVLTDPPAPPFQTQTAPEHRVPVH